MDRVLNTPTTKQKIHLDQPTSNPTEDASNEPPAVLSPDHPLLEKFQQALKAHLLKVNNELAEEIADLDFTISKLNRDRENFGSDLYDYQAEIERQKDAIDTCNNQLKDVSDRRIQHEMNAANLKKEYDSINYNYKESKRIHNERLMELSHVQILENKISKWSKEIEDEVETAKRMVSKDGQNQLAISQQKKQMDLILFNLDEEVRRRERELVNINEQLAEQSGFVEILNRSISDANADLSALQNEQKRLLAAWNEVIMAIGQRDKVLVKIRNDLE